MRSLIAVLCLASASSVLVAQTPQPARKGGADYVAVNVVVTDENRRPIADLSRADFTVTADGRPQTIEDFELVSIAAQSATAGIPSAPDVATNADLTPKSRIFVIVIDDLHLLDSHAAAAKQATLELLKSLAPDDEAAVIFTGRSELGENFTRDRARLTDAADRVITAVSGGLGAALSPAALKAARTSAFALRNAAASLAGSSHGRRAVFFISGGSALNLQASSVENELKDAEVLQGDLDAIYAAAHRADAPIYCLDPRGAVTPDTAVRVKIASADDRREVEHRLRIQQARLTAISAATGGRAIVNAPDVGAAARELMADNGTYYVLGIRPSPLPRDGAFHEVNVRVTRPGVTVRARSGYVAPEPPERTADVSAALDRALSAGVNVTALPLRMFVTPVTASPTGMVAVVSIEVTYPVGSADARKIDDDLHLTIFALDPDATVRATSSRALRFSGTAAAGGSVTFMVDDVIDLPALPLTVRAGVASRALGVAGTVQMSLDIPDPSRGPLTMSGVVLGYTGPTRQAVMSAELLKTYLPLQPTTVRTFAASDTLRVFARFFWHTNDETVQVSLAVNGPTPFPTQSARNAGQVTGSWHIAVLDAGLPLKNFTPGSYTLEVTAALANGQTVKREVPFEVK